MIANSSSQLCRSTTVQCAVCTLPLRYYSLSVCNTCSGEQERSQAFARGQDKPPQTKLCVFCIMRLKMTCNDFLVVKVNCPSYVYNISKSIWILRNIKKLGNFRKSARKCAPDDLFTFASDDVIPGKTNGCLYLDKCKKLQFIGLHTVSGDGSKTAKGIRKAMLKTLTLTFRRC